MCVCCHLIYSGRQVCGRTSRGHTEFLHLSFAVRALIFLAKMIQRFLSLVDREVVFFVLRFNRSPLLGTFYFIFVRKIPVRVTTPRFELMSQRQKISRLPSEPPRRTVKYCRIYYSHRVKTIILERDPPS